MWPFKKKPEQVEELKPGTCECSHLRSCHVDGKGRCKVGFPRSEEWPNGAVCACQVYIRDDDDDEDPEPDTPTPSELEQLYRR
jgi:hypothetical protein